MSYSLCINIWFDKEDSLNSYLSVLVSASQVYLEHGGNSRHFSRVQLFDKPFSKADDFAPAAGDLDEARSYLEDRWSETARVSIDSVYPYLGYDEDLDATVKLERPLQISLNGADFADGYHRKRFGHVEISFDNIASFLVPQALIENVARAETTEKMSKWAALITEVVRNYDYVRRLIQIVIGEARPRHLLSCTESDVNPLVAHDIYHERLEDFSVDLLKIAKLHEYGGVYFCDLPPSDPAFLPPWKQTTYGHWRGLYGRNNSQELVSRLQPYIDQLLSRSQRVEVSTELIEKCLVESPDVLAERFGGSYLISSRASSMFYIEHPYLCLFDHLLNARV